jgi:hypothetical protein
MIYKYYTIITIDKNTWKEVEPDILVTQIKMLCKTNIVLGEKVVCEDHVKIYFLYREQEKNLIHKVFNNSHISFHEIQYSGIVPDIFYHRVYRFKEQ